VALAWSVPSDGGSPITNYRVYRSTATGTETLLTTLGNVTTFNDTGLTNGITYFYKVSAVNAVGESVLSNERSATPATVPGARTLPSAPRGDGPVTVSWNAPPNGGSPIPPYPATASPGGASCTTVGLSCNVVGLTNGTSYSFTVTATNAFGTGPASNIL